jgi:hypothetical protein
MQINKIICDKITIFIWYLVERVGAMGSPTSSRQNQGLQTELCIETRNQCFYAHEAISAQ